MAHYRYPALKTGRIDHSPHHPGIVLLFLAT